MLALADPRACFQLLRSGLRSRMGLRRLALGGLALILLVLSTPPSVEAQLWDRIKSKSAERLKAHKAQADSAVEKTAVGAVDSTLEKTGRGVDSVMTATNRVVATTLNGIEGAAYSLFQGDRKKSDALAHALASGSLVLREIEFEKSSPQLSPKGQQVLEQLAEAVRATPGTFLIEGYTDALGDSTATRALSDHRAAAVKASLVAAGIPAGRLFARGGGATAPARIELSRIQ